MDILFVCPRYDATAGDGIYATKVGEALRLLGVNVHVVTLRDGLFTFLPDPSYNCLQGKVRPTKASDGFWRTNYYSAIARTYVRSALEATGPELIHVHGIHQHFTLAAMLELKRSGRPIVLSVHDYKCVCGNAGFFSDRTQKPCVRCIKGRVIPPVLERCKKGSFMLSLGTSIQMAMWKYGGGNEAFSSFVVGSKFLHSLLERNAPIASRLKLIPFPRVCDPPESIRTNLPAVGFVGRFVPVKGVLVFAKAVKGLQVPVHLFGAGVDEPEARRILNGQENVMFHGWQPHAVIDQHLGFGTIVVLPSLAYETFGFAAVEAMARGACVLTVRRGAMSDLIEDGVNGYLVDEPDPVLIRTRLDELLRNPPNILEVGKKARDRVMQLPSLSEHANALLTHYRDLLSQTP